jgi:integrase
VADITRADVRKLIESKAAIAPVSANRLLGLLSRVWRFGVKRDLLTVNPIDGIEAPTKETPKDRVLTEAEIKKVWKGLDKVRSAGADVLKLILLTMQRPGEVCTVEWSEVDLDTGIWSLPAKKAKNGLAHRIPLTETALEILKAQPRESRYVFPGKQTGSHLDTGSVSRLLNEHDQFGVAKFTPHDCRRTAASHAARIGVPRLVVQRLLNHAERGVTAQVYERYSYDKEKQDGLVKLERELLRILGRSKAGNVVAIAG